MYETPMIMADAMAAAVTAAAEIAKNCNMYLHDNMNGNQVRSPSFVMERQQALLPSMMQRGYDHSYYDYEQHQAFLRESYSASVVGEGHAQQHNLTGASQRQVSITDEDTYDDAEKRLARSRERNREHARRTRLRKKAQLDALQNKVKDLEAEGRDLKQRLEDCNNASILLGLSTGISQPNSENIEALLDDATQINERHMSSMTRKVSLISEKTNKGGRRKRFYSEADLDNLSADNSRKVKSSQKQFLKLDAEGHLMLIDGDGDNDKTHINWKSGIYCDEDGVTHQLSPEKLEYLRRERNRLHAKMTRDRKKGFISAVQKTIQELEMENRRMRDVLTKVGELRQLHGLSDRKSADPSPQVSSPLFTALTSTATEKLIENDEENVEFARKEISVTPEPTLHTDDDESTEQASQDSIVDSLEEGENHQRLPLKKRQKKTIEAFSSDQPFNLVG